MQHSERNHRLLPDNPFGVLDFLAWDHEWNAHHYPIDAVKHSAQLMQEAGVGTVRIDFLWSDVEPQKGRFNFEKYEAIAQILADHQLQILGLLHYNPDWRSGIWNDAPKFSDYHYYALQMVKHFKNVVHDWEIWNEPDHSVYWQPQDNLKAYSALLQSVYPIIKQEDSSCRVLMGGLSDPLQNLNRIYTLAGRQCFDVVNIHPFVSPLLSNASAELSRIYQQTFDIMKQQGDEAKPLWFTEIGCPGVPVDVASDPWWLGKNPNEAEQAEWVQKIYSDALKWKGVQKIFWAFFRDTPAHFKNGTDYFGLVGKDFSLKPAYKTYQSLAQGGNTRSARATEEAQRN